MSVLKVAAQKVNLLLIAAAAVFSVACAGEEPRTSYASTDVESGGVTLGQPVQCEAGAIQSCTIWLGQHGDLANCVHGVDVCTAGEWSGCIDEETMAENPELYGDLAGEAS
jgi:hypothetical protein